MDGVLSRFLDGLKSSSDEIRLSTVAEIRRFVASELKEAAASNYAEFIEDLCVEFEGMLSGSDPNEKKGAILAIGCLAEIDFSAIAPYYSQFINLLNLLSTSSDLPLLVLAARLLGEFGLLLPNDFAEGQIKRACEYLKRGSLSTSQKQFYILTLREAALHTPISYYHHLTKCLPVLLQYFREKDIVLRDLAAMALRNTLAIAAENEIGRRGQQMSLDSDANVDGLGDSAAQTSANRAIPSSSSRQFLRGIGNTPIRKFSSSQQPAVLQANSCYCPVNEPPMIWYHQCVGQVLFTHAKAIAIKSSDHRVPAVSLNRKMSRDEWAHGSLLILNELLVYANPEFEKLRSSLDSMVEQPIFHVLVVNQTEGELAVRSVNQTPWPVVISPSQQMELSLVPGTHLSALSSSVQVYGDEGVASELLRQQQFRQQRAVPLVSEACQRMLGANLDKIWELVLGCLNLKHTGVLHLVLKVIPRLVAFERSTFLNRELVDVTALVLKNIAKPEETSQSILREVINFLFDCVNRDREKGYALVTLGLMTHTVGDEFEKHGYLSQLISVLLNQLNSTKDVPASKKRLGGLSTAVLLTIGLIAKSLGSRACSSLKPLLDPMISRGLSQPMTMTCTLVAEYIPELKRDVQDSLLKRINVILANSIGIGAASSITLGNGTVPCVLGPVPPGANTASAHLAVAVPRISSTRGRNSLAHTSSVRVRTSSIPLPGFPWGEAFSKNFSSADFDPSGDALSESQLVAVALRTLGNFDFEGYTLAYCVRHTAENFISISACGVRGIRLEGVRTCLRLMLPLIKSAELVPSPMQKTLDAISDILGKLLIVGICDPDAEVRKCVFSSLDSQFDNYLAQSRHLNSLFVALNDEVFAIRGLVMQCLGRLSDVNPACVQPTLRSVLLKIITDLADSGTTKNKEESAALVAILAATAPHFILPYGESLLHVIIPQIRNALPINLRMKLLIMRNERLQKAANKLGACSFSYHGGVPTDTNEISLSTALLASQSAAHSAAQAVQAVATATARGVSQQLARSVASARAPLPTSSQTTAVCARAVVAANQAAHSAAIAARVISTAIGRQGKCGSALYDEFPTSHGLGYPEYPRSGGCELDLLIGEPHETLPGTSQEFLAAAASLGGGEGPETSRGFLVGTLDAIRPGEIGGFMSPNQLSIPGTLRAGRRILENTNAIWREPKGLVVALFSALAHLSSVCPQAVVTLMDDLIPVLVYMLQDPTCHAKRSVAAWAFGVLVSNTGYVVRPYMKHPDLMELLFALLRSVESKSIQIEILRLLGLIGAVDPFKLKVSMGQYDYIQETDTAVSQYDIAESRDVDITQSELLVNLCWDNREEFFAGYSLSALINILREPGMRSNWDHVVRVIASVLESFNQRAIPCLHQVMMELFKCLQGLHETKLQEAITHHMCSIVQIIGPFAKEFASEIVDIITTYWNFSASHIVQRNCIRLAGVIAKAIKTDFRPSMPRLLPCILRCLKQEMVDENLIALCDLISDLGTLLDGHLHILLPALTSLVANLEDAPYEHLLRTSLEAKHSQSAQSITTVTTIAANAGSMPVSQSAAVHAFSSSCSPESVEVINATSPSYLDDSFVMGTPVDSLLVDSTGGGGSVGGGVTIPSRSALRAAQRAANSPSVPGSLQTRLAALRCITRVTEVLCVESLAANIVQPLCRLLNALYERSLAVVEVKNKPSAPRLALKALYPPCMDVIANLALQMGSAFKFIMPVVQVTLNLINIPHKRFDMAIEKVNSDGYRRPNLSTDGQSISQDTHANFTRKTDPDKLVKNYTLNSLNLQRAWQSSRLSSPEDWNLWLKTLSVSLLRESPSPAIRACARLTTIAPHVSRRLFNAAFMSCWKELRDAEQDDLINTLENVLRLPSSASQSREISQVILNLEEFMAHADKFSGKAPRVHLPLSLNLLADRAMKNRAFAKALRYKELEFLDEVEKRSSPNPSTLASLLAIYDKLQLTEASNGVLLYATKNPRNKLTDEELWYEKLHNWDRAIALCDRKLEDERIRDKTKPILCRLRCLHSLGQWSQLESMAWERWGYLSEGAREQVAPLATSAAITIGAWGRAAHYTQAFAPADHEGGFYRALLALHEGNYAAALDEVAKSRSILAANLIPLTTEGYQRTYPDLVDAQLLSEVEEVIQYKLVPERRAVLHEAWHHRLLGCQSVVEDWGRIIQLRRLVLDPRENIKSCLRYAGLCRRSGRLSLSLQVLLRMLPKDPSEVAWNEVVAAPDPAIVFSYTKLLWASGSREEAVTRLQVLRDSVIEPSLRAQATKLEEIGQEVAQQPFIPSTSITDIATRIDDLRSLMTKCSLRLGSWYTDLYIRSSPDVGGSRLPNSGLFSYSPGVSQFKQLSISNEVQQNGTSDTAAQYGVVGLGGNAHFVDDKSVMMHKFVIKCYRTATEHSPGNRSAWQAWAMANYDLSTRLGTEQAQLDQKEIQIKQIISSESSLDHTTLKQSLAGLGQRRSILQRSIEQLAAPSVRGYINSISISSDSNLQDILRLINLLFQFGHLPEIREIAREGLGKIRLQNWLPVLQQLLARIDTPHEHVANIIVDLLIAVGRQFPQALIYSLVLSFKSGGSDRRRYYATKILYFMEEHSPRLVYEAFLLNEELIRLSVSWMEMWFECLEDASRVYFGEKDTEKMFRLLYPLHQVMERGHETANEAAFLQEFGKELNNSRIYCERFENQGMRADLQQAWEGYYTLYRTLSKRVSNLSSLDLTCAAPRLHAYGKDWMLAVPGTYKPHLPLVRLAGVKNCLMVMTSKQHPRKCTMLGSNGKTYVFLLKGHEDTRQDERVMQFFGLINTLLMINPETLRRNLTIQRFSIIPLSTNTGLIGWVPNSDTLHSLIREYRDKTDITLNQEHREMLHLAPDFDRLNLSQKTEVFEAGLRVSSGRDLANILWLKSHNSEVWFERRTTFIRSIAVMSMVGYILGLGDRHPSNLMLCRETGKIVHIDFGDCFEVAMMREKYPEKVPFRLTRMLIAAMEVTGIDGVYRHTCETMMQLMRSNRDSLLAVLEAFIHDPLLQWVLLENKRPVLGPAAGGGVGVNNQGVPPPPPAPPLSANSTAPAQQALRGLPTQQQQQTMDGEGEPHTKVPLGAGVGGGARYPQTRVSQQSQNTSAHSRNIPYVFTDPNYPSSLSLRDCRHINPWRHHLCNGPWLGCYETAKATRRQTESGAIVCERVGMQNFIFSAKPPSESEYYDEMQTGGMGNTRARDVLSRIRRKLDGNENGAQTSVPLQVDDLIREATSVRNISQMYIGWCAFW
ncbi:FKBP12 rapamycin complex associated protein [Echinococcus multilocularis]|uniref:non-specific serine/threonine protein kinase n=1 Tax=Echinococcus multilocularis TaxID=6211 RepID=A0A068Y675_ECHMU|nr:FKBP12 rapamycin complex associated protein [Echinococcus multilocularis]